VSSEASVAVESGGAHGDTAELSNKLSGGVAFNASASVLTLSSLIPFIETNFICSIFVFDTIILAMLGMTFSPEDFSKINESTFMFLNSG